MAAVGRGVVFDRFCDPEHVSLNAVASAAGMARRTLERLFVRETGMSVGQWRQRLRLMQALRLLAEGESVTRVSVRAGYSTPSAFTHAFRRAMGQPPSRYFA